MIETSVALLKAPEVTHEGSWLCHTVSGQFGVEHGIIEPTQRVPADLVPVSLSPGDDCVSGGISKSSLRRLSGIPFHLVPRCYLA